MAGIEGTNIWRSAAGFFAGRHHVIQGICDSVTPNVVSLRVLMPNGGDYGRHQKSQIEARDGFDFGNLDLVRGNTYRMIVEPRAGSRFDFIALG